MTYELEDLPPRYRAQAVEQLGRRPTTGPGTSTRARTGHPGPSEKRWQETVCRIADAGGWWYYHPFDSRRSAAGWPDLCFVRERVVFAELKKQDGKLNPAQVEVLGRLKGAGAEVYVWRPQDEDTVRSVLA